MLIATFIFIVVNLNRTRRTSSVDCPGDTISYECSVVSDRSPLFLTWIITFPNNLGLIPITITYNMSSTINSTSTFPMDTSIRFTDMGAVYLVSAISFSNLIDDGLVGTEIQCKREDAEMMTKILQLVTIGKLYIISRNNRSSRI